MKKIFVLAIAMMFAAISVSAQDMGEATEAAKAANEAIMAGNYSDGLAQWKQALELAEMCGGEGMELADQAKDQIPRIMMTICKNDVKAKNYDAAISMLGETIAAAKSYNNSKVVNDATELLAQVKNQKAGELLNSKDFAGAAEAYKALVAEDPTNGMAQLRLGMSLASLGNMDEAVAAYEAAMANGQEKNAGKQLSTIFLKKAQASLKAGKFADAVAEAEKSNSYVESANAYKIAASAATKLDKKADAINFYEKYLEVAPNANDANGIICTLAVLYQQGGDKVKALEYYEKILTDPKYGETAKAQIAALKK